MDIVLRSAVVFLFVMVVMRLLGRRELSKMQPFDLLILVVIADFVQQGVTQQDYSVTGAVLAVGTFALMIAATSWISWRFPRARPILDGNPVVLVEDGKPIDDNLRRERISVEEIAAQARIQQIDSLRKIRWAILETSGEISFIPKSGS
jgi:uncharacterized membrane protein YcaP (DUF421 family)